MEYKKNGLPLKNFSVNTKSREESQELKKIIHEHYKDVHGYDHPEYTNNDARSWHYGVDARNVMRYGEHSYSTAECVYTLDQFKSFLKPVDRVVNTYPIF